MRSHRMLLMALLAFPLSAAAQSGEGSETAMGFGAGYMPEIEGLTLSMTLVPIHRGIGWRPVNQPDAPLTGGFSFKPMLSGDVIITSDEDTPYYRESYSNLCVDNRDGSYVGDALCAPEMAFAGRLDIGFSPGQSGMLWAGPGVRYTDELGFQAYAFFTIGRDFFLKGSIGEGYQQLEFGLLMGI